MPDARKSIFITGAASGMGRETARLFASKGWFVGGYDVNEAGLADLRDELGRKNCLVRRLDVTDRADFREALDDFAPAAGGRLDILFNNAGIAIRRPTTELTLEDWSLVVAVNMTGVFLCAREAARHMLAGGRGGRIVNTASIMGVVGGGLYPNISYQATKGAVVNMTRALAVEWAGQGIRVNAIAPTWVRTPLTRGITEQPELVQRIQQLTPMGRLAEPEELVGAVLFLASRASAMVTGHVLAVDGGFLAQ
jgi:NAD(P)-dependent dehydrogenase (short-subunit alcohol dehydrogenase family)